MNTDLILLLLAAYFLGISTASSVFRLYGTKREDRGRFTKR